MEILKATKFYWRVLGILSFQFLSDGINVWILFIQRVCVVCCLLISIFTTLKFFLTQAQQLNEISESFVFAFTHFIMLTWHSLSVWKSKEIEEYLDNLQTQICKSKFLTVDVSTTYGFCIIIC